MHPSTDIDFQLKHWVEEAHRIDAKLGLKLLIQALSENCRPYLQLNSVQFLQPASDRFYVKPFFIPIVLKIAYFLGHCSYSIKSLHGCQTQWGQAEIKLSARSDFTRTARTTCTYIFNVQLESRYYAGLKPCI